MNFPRDYIIKTQRCRLRRVSENDIPHIFSATRFKGFNDGMLWDPPSNKEELYEPLKHNLEAWDLDTAYNFTIESLQEEMFIGRISIRKTSEEGTWNIGFFIHPLEQGKGYMTEAVRAILDFGFTQLGATRIEARHAIWNKKSERILTKIGMKFIHYIPQGFMKKGTWVEENLLAIDRKTWNANK